MDTAALLERAIAFAVARHAGQTDKVGRPYILHPLRVMAAMTTDEAPIVAVLHDVVEDTDATFDDLAALGLPEAVLAALRLLTHEADDGSEEAYLAYVERLRPNPLARAVKLADLADNLDLNRLPAVTEKDARRLDKYLRAKAVLLRPA